MTIQSIATWAQRKGLDLLGTGDCLQADWLQEIEASMMEAEPGLLTLRPEAEDAAGKPLPARLRRPLRFVVSTEVCCAPPGTPELGGLHHLIYFRSLDSARRFRARVAPFGDLREGRPTLALESHQLLAAVTEHGDGCQIAPAHLFNPWYSSLGSVSGARTLTDVFGEHAPSLLAAEMGLTSTPPMCRRLSSLDRYALFCCSDAHSLENLGREHTLLEIEPDYTALVEALRAGSSEHIRGLVKFPVERTRYYRNRCGVCQRSFDGKECPRCGRPLVMGSRDRLDVIADRSEPNVPPGAPLCQQLLPLAYVLAELMGIESGSKSVRTLHDRLLEAVGSERHILITATQEEIADASTQQLARIIVTQRTVPARSEPEKEPTRSIDQLSLGL